MYTGLVHAHTGFAYLIVLSTSISLLLALFSRFVGPRPTVTAVAILLVRAVETSLAGLLFLLGLAMWVVLPWPATTWWTWPGIAAVIGSGVLVSRGLKPTIQAVQAGDARAGNRWVALSALHWSLFVTTFFVMMVGHRGTLLD